MKATYHGRTMDTENTGPNNHDGCGHKPGVRSWRCSKCKKTMGGDDIPVGWYHISVTTNLEGEGLRYYSNFACSRPCYDWLKIARMDSFKA